MRAVNNNTGDSQGNGYISAVWRTMYCRLHIL